jgi:hypothetical protein
MHINSWPILMQVGSMNKHQGVTQCTPHGSDVSNWDHWFIGLERMMAQVVVTMTKNIGNNDPKPRGWVDSAIDSHYDPMWPWTKLWKEFIATNNQPKSGT